MHFDLQNTTWHPYRYIPLFLTMVAIFADTGISKVAAIREVSWSMLNQLRLKPWTHLKHSGTAQHEVECPLHGSPTGLMSILFRNGRAPVRLLSWENTPKKMHITVREHRPTLLRLLYYRHPRIRFYLLGPPSALSFRARTPFRGPGFQRLAAIWVSGRCSQSCPMRANWTAKRCPRLVQYPHWCVQYGHESGGESNKWWPICCSKQLNHNIRMGTSRRKGLRTAMPTMGASPEGWG